MFHLLERFHTYSLKSIGKISDKVLVFVKNHSSYLLVLLPTAFIGYLWYQWATHGRDIAGHFTSGNDTKEAASWGDSFGSFNALISALGFAGVLITVFMQGRSLSRQQYDAVKQARQQHKQQFEQTFFELLNLMRQIRSEIFFKYSPQFIAASGRTATNVARGPEALSRAGREVTYWIREAEKSGPLTSKDLARIYITRIHARNEPRLGAYYRIIYTILRRISEDEILNCADKVSYGNLLRSQLQSREVSLIALNGLTRMSNDFKNYLIEFRIMKYIFSVRLRRILISAGYPSTAFESRD